MKRYVPRPKESPTAWFRCMTRNCDCKMIKCEVAEKNILNAMLYCDAITDTMTKGLEQQKACVRYNILTSAMDVTFLYYLLPKYGMEGYFVSFLVTHLVNFILSLRRLLRITGERLPPPTFPCWPCPPRGLHYGAQRDWLRFRHGAWSFSFCCFVCLPCFRSAKKRILSGFSALSG